MLNVICKFFACAQSLMYKTCYADVPRTVQRSLSTSSLEEGGLLLMVGHWEGAGVASDRGVAVIKYSLYT